MRKLLFLTLTLICLLAACITPAAAYTWLFETPCFTAGVNNDYCVNLYATPIVLESINYTRYYYDSYSPDYEKAPFILFAPDNGDYTFTVTDVTPQGSYYMPDSVVFHFIEEDLHSTSGKTETGREFVFHYKYGKAESFTIPDCTKGYMYKLHILPKEGSATSLECYAYLTVCFDGYHKAGVISDLEIPASCGKEGTRYLGCTLCHTVTETQVLPALSHEMEPYQLVTKATCTQEGQIGTVCKNCGLQEDLRSIGKKNHTPVLTVTEKAGHCTDGSYEIRCEMCDTQLSTGTVHSDNQHSPRLRFVERPTCTAGGSYEVICSICDEVLDKGDCQPLGHQHVSTWANEDGYDRFEADQWLFYADVCTRCFTKRPFIFPSLIILLVIAVALIIASIVMIVVLFRVWKRRCQRTPITIPSHQ